MDFECDECGKMFASPLYGISWERAHTDFSEGDDYPSVVISCAEVIRNFCSAKCRDAGGREKLLAEKEARATFPDIGPWESCSRCGGGVDMAKEHCSLVEATEMDSETGVMQNDIEYLAVFCTKCEPV